MLQQLRRAPDRASPESANAHAGGIVEGIQNCWRGGNQRLLADTLCAERPDR